MHDFGEDVWLAVEDERRALVAGLVEDPALRASALADELRGSPPGPGTTAVRIARWAVAASMGVARGILEGAARGAQDGITEAAASWLAEEFARNPGPEPVSRAARRDVIVGVFRASGVAEEDARRKTELVLVCGEKIAARALSGHAAALFAREDLRRLRETLGELYPTLGAAQVVTADVGLVRARLPSTGTSEEFWFEAIEECVRTGRLGLLVDRVTGEYHGDARLFEAARALGLVG